MTTMTTNGGVAVKRLFYAVNPHKKEFFRHLAYNVVLGACDKIGGLGMRGQAPKKRALSKAPPSLVGKADRIMLAKRALNAFGRERYLYASEDRRAVEQQLKEWSGLHAQRRANRLNKRTKVSTVARRKVEVD